MGESMDDWAVYAITAALAVASFLVYRQILAVRLLWRIRANPPSVREAATPPPHLEGWSDEIRARFVALGLSPSGRAEVRLTHSSRFEWCEVFLNETGTVGAFAIPHGFHESPASLSFVSVDEAGHVIDTVAMGDVAAVPPTANWRRDLLTTPDLAAALEHHRGRIAGASVRAMDALEPIEAAVNAHWASWSASLESGLAASDPAGAHLTWAGVWRERGVLLAANKQLRRVARRKAPPLPSVPVEVVAQGDLAHERNQSRTPPLLATVVVGVASALSFGVFAAIYFGATIVPLLVVVLLVHELGHWSAMRAFGYRDTRIFFVPLLGAATAGHKRDATIGQEMVVLLAGPVPGLLFGLAVLCAPYVYPESALWVADPVDDLALWFVSINALNLLPFLPLDGGRIVQRLIGSPQPWVDAGLRVAAGVAFVLAALLLQDFVSGFLAFFCVVGLVDSFQDSKIAESLVGARDAPPLERRTEIHRSLRRDPRNQTRPTLLLFERARRIEDRLGRPPDSLAARLLWLLAYLSAFVLPFVYMAVMVVVMWMREFGSM